MLNFNNEHRKMRWKQVKENLKEIDPGDPVIWVLGSVGVAAIVFLGLAVSGIAYSINHSADVPEVQQISAITQDVDGGKQIVECESFNYTTSNHKSIVHIKTLDGYDLYMDSRNAKFFVGEGAHEKAEEYLQSLSVNTEGFEYETDSNPYEIQEEVTYHRSL